VGVPSGSIAGITKLVVKPLVVRAVVDTLTAHRFVVVASLSSTADSTFIDR